VKSTDLLPVAAIAIFVSLACVPHVETNFRKRLVRGPWVWLLSLMLAIGLILAAACAKIGPEPAAVAISMAALVALVAAFLPNCEN